MRYNSVSIFLFMQIHILSDLLIADLFYPLAIMGNRDMIPNKKHGLNNFIKKNLIKSVF